MKEEKDIFSFISTEKTAVPDDSYFVSLANKVIASKATETKVIPLYKKPFFKWAVAASIVLPLALYFLAPGTTNNSQEQSVLIGMNDIPREDIHAYIMDNMEEFNFSEVIEMVPIETVATFETETVTLETNTSSSFFDDISKEEIERYFESEDIDLEELEQEGLFI